MKCDKQINEATLFEAIKSKNCDETRHLINNVIDINSKDGSGWTALMYAAEKKDKKTVRLLIEFGADVNSRDDEGQTALMQVIFIHANGISRILIENGADINIKDNSGQTPLMIAAYVNNKEIGELLIIEGADIGATDNLGKDAYSIAHEKWSFKTNDFFLKNKLSQNEVNNAKIGHYLQTIHFYDAFGNTIAIASLLDGLRNRYKCKITISDVQNYADSINRNTSRKTICCSVNENELKVLPGDAEVRDFLSNELITREYVSLSNVQIKFFKAYKCDLPDYVLNNFINNFNRSNLSRMLVKDGERILLTQNYYLIQNFLSAEFKDKEYGYISDVKEKFLKQTDYVLPDSILHEFIRTFGNRTNSKSLEELSNGFIQVIPEKTNV